MNNDLDQKINTKLDQIAEHFLHRNEAQNEIGLFGGDAGIALFLGLYYKHSQDERYYEKLNETINNITKLLHNGNNVSSPLSMGLSGLGWLMLFLKEKGIIDIDDHTFFEQIDSYLTSSLLKYIKQRRFDQLHGALSVTMYFLKRNLPNQVETMLEALNQTKVNGENEIKWIRHHQQSKMFVYDFGLAHGIAGNLYFLSKCYHTNILPELSQSLIKGVNHFFVNNTQPQESIGSFFPNSIKTEDYSSNHPNHEKSRLAWCYGDLGILYTSFLSGKLTGNQNLVEDSVEKLLKVTERIDVEQTQVVDAGFCHGAAGAAHIFNKIKVQTGNEVFGRAADHWFSRVLEYADDKKGNCGYLFMEKRDEWIPSKGLLTGLAGIGLTLLSRQNTPLINWDECLLLS